MSRGLCEVVVVASLTLATAFMVAGCGGNSRGNANPTPPADQIKAIQNNSHMPPQAKAMAIQQIKARSHGAVR